MNYQVEEKLLYSWGSSKITGLNLFKIYINDLGTNSYSVQMQFADNMKWEESSK